MNQNLGKLDRIFRFIFALWWFSYAGIPWKIRSLFQIVMFIISVIALVESFTGYCHLHELLKINNKNQ